ncbi:prefoldin subunit beta [Thermococci archaeon]|nr:MAG: prefoldin subunit beta [Thermococci archaeon]
MTEELPPRLRNMVSQLQQLQQQAQVIHTQRRQYEIQLAETERALEELNKVKDDAEVRAYKMIGNVLVTKGVNEIINELEDRKESLETRIKTLSNQESRIMKKIQDLQEKIRTEIGGVGAG